jgi:transcriptional regulator with XRE-family HTH domain
MPDQHHGSDDSPESSWPTLRDVRAERLLSIRELARLANVAPSTIYLIETGRSIPHPAVIRRLATALAVDPHTIAEFRRAIRHRGGLR